MQFDLNTAPVSSPPLEMDGVCIKIGLIFPVALQEAIKNLRLGCRRGRHWLAFISRVALTREGGRGSRNGKKKRTAFEKFSSNGHSSLSCSLSPSHYQKGAGATAGFLEKFAVSNEELKLLPLMGNWEIRT